MTLITALCIINRRGVVNLNKHSSLNAGGSWCGIAGYYGSTAVRSQSTGTQQGETQNSQATLAGIIPGSFAREILQVTNCGMQALQ
jgi:hypothetical protein